MTMLEARPPITPGEPAPDFTLPAVDRNENVSLADYRGRSPVFLALMVGLWCPFCRRQIAQIGTIEGKLKALGVESLAVVATPPENARLYFKFRPTRVRLASDPELAASSRRLQGAARSDQVGARQSRGTEGGTRAQNRAPQAQVRRTQEARRGIGPSSRCDHPW